MAPSFLFFMAGATSFESMRPGAAGIELEIQSD
jgi:hypothetical protein